MTNGRPPNVLSIAGSDPSGGAGVQADLKTFSALGVYGMAVPTALTAQNTRGVFSIDTVAPHVVRAQLDAVFADVRVDAVKIGMLGRADVARAVAAALREYAPPIVVLDPVLRASAGRDLAGAGTVEVVRDELLSLVTLVTPNADEAGALLGEAPPRTVAESRATATAIVERGARAALVTGGHLAQEENVVDVLYDGAVIRELRVARERGPGAHGTGCTLSSAIAARLAHGDDLAGACATAQRFVAAAIAHSTDLDVGHGRAPVHPLGSLWGAQRPRGVTGDGPGIRLATPADSTRMAALGARLFEETFGPDNDPENVREYLAQAFTPGRVGAELSAGDRVAWIVEHAVDGAIGYAMLRRDARAEGVVAARPAEVQRIYLDRRWQGRGVANALMAACVTQARDWGCDVLWLGVWERNPRAIAFYEKAGFRRVGYQSFTLGRAVQQDHVMVRPLT